MRTVWDIEDIVAGIKVKKPLGAGLFADFIIANYFSGGAGVDAIWGIFHVGDGEFIRVGSGIREALLVHLNNCGFVRLEE